MLQSNPVAHWAGVLALSAVGVTAGLAPLASMAQPMLPPATGDYGAPVWQGAAYNLRQLGQSVLDDRGSFLVFRLGRWGR